jgi:hypothetical protein
MGVATLEELDRQREVVHGMDQRLENMTADLKHNERHLRGIESIGGAIANKATKDKTKRNDLVFVSREEKIMQVQKRDAEVEVLFKFANDKLVPALLIFKEKVFVCAEAGNKTKLIMTGAQWEYTEVKMVLLRARHQHLDVWFKTGGKEKRIRMMTSHVQWTTNEFALRCRAVLFSFFSSFLLFQVVPNWTFNLSPELKSLTMEASNWRSFLCHAAAKTTRMEDGVKKKKKNENAKMF